jgi:hypothetical protein
MRIGDDRSVTTGKPRFVDLRTGWFLVAVGLAFGIAAVLMLVSSVGSAMNDVFFRDPCPTPCTEVRNLEKGHYLVFEQIGSSRSIGPLSSRTQRPATISPDDVTVTSSSGRLVEVGEPSSSQTIDRNGTTYGGVVSFHVPESGRYRVSVIAPDETRVLVAPGLGQTFVTAFPGLVVAGLGLVAGVLGLVALILAWVRRQNTSLAA